MNPGEKVEDVHKKRGFHGKFLATGASMIKDAYQDFFTSFWRSTHQWTTCIKLGRNRIFLNCHVFFMLGLLLALINLKVFQSSFDFITYLTGWWGRKGSARDTFDGIVVFYYMFPITHTFSGVDYKGRVISVSMLPKIANRCRLSNIQNQNWKFDFYVKNLVIISHNERSSATM